MLREKIQEIIENNQSSEQKAITILEYLNLIGVGLRARGWLLDDPILSDANDTNRPRLGVNLEPRDDSDVESYYVLFGPVYLGLIFNIPPAKYWHFKYMDEDNPSHGKVADDQYMAAKALLEHAMPALKKEGFA